MTKQEVLHRNKVIITTESKLLFSNGAPELQTSTALCLEVMMTMYASMLCDFKLKLIMAFDIMEGLLHPTYT